MLHTHPSIAHPRLRTAFIVLLGTAILTTYQGVPAKTPETNSARTIPRKFERVQLESVGLRTMEGRKASLGLAPSRNCAVITFLGTECPLVQLYVARLKELHDDFSKRGVVFVGVDSNQQDSLSDLTAFAKEHDIPFPVLKDPGNALADLLQATRTPEAIVLVRVKAQDTWRVAYQGQIDDQLLVGGIVRSSVPHPYLRQAIEQVVSNQPIATARTTPVGCLIGRKREPDPNAPVTYARDVSRILQKHCVSCHHDGDIAPFELTAYEEVVGWAEMIREVVDEGRMPPWHASPDYGHFANARGLSKKEREQLFAWVDAGAPLGDTDELPEPLAFVEGWQLPRRPDRVIAMPKSFTVPAHGTVDYQYFKVDPQFKEDHWVEAAEVIPGDRSVVHHILIFMRSPNAGRGQTPDVIHDEFLAGYVPGLRLPHLPQGMAKKIPAGTQLIFQVHYTPVGTARIDRSRLGLIFADPEQVTHRVLTTKAFKDDFAIPPHTRSHRVEASTKPSPIEFDLLSMSPHTHVRGKSFLYAAVYPDGKRQILLDVPNYDFNWQSRYELKQPLKLPAGTRIQCVARYDNSADNPANPDPAKQVRWGDQTWQEMMIGYFDIAIPRQAGRPTPRD